MSLLSSKDNNTKFNKEREEDTIKVKRLDGALNQQNIEKVTSAFIIRKGRNKKNMSYFESKVEDLVFIYATYVGSPTNEETFVDIKKKAEGNKIYDVEDVTETLVNGDTVKLFLPLSTVKKINEQFQFGYTNKLIIEFTHQQELSGFVRTDENLSKPCLITFTTSIFPNQIHSVIGVYSDLRDYSLTSKLGGSDLNRNINKIPEPIKECPLSKAIEEYRLNKLHETSRIYNSYSNNKKTEKNNANDSNITNSNSNNSVTSNNSVSSNNDQTERKSDIPF